MHATCAAVTAGVRSLILRAIQITKLWLLSKSMPPSPSAVYLLLNAMCYSSYTHNAVGGLVMTDLWLEQHCFVSDIHCDSSVSPRMLSFVAGLLQTSAQEGPTEHSLEGRTSTQEGPTEQSLEEQTKAVFAHCDADGDGKLTKQDIYNHLVDNRTNVSHISLDKIFRKLSQGNTYLTLPQLLQASWLVQNPAAWGLGPHLLFS